MMNDELLSVGHTVLKIADGRLHGLQKELTIYDIRYTIYD